MQFNIENVEIDDDAGLLAELVKCWRVSVAATQMVRTPDDIARSAGYVPDAMASVAHGVVCQDDAGAVAGFLGVDGAMVEMLFIDPALRGRGLGTRLLDYATNKFGATLVYVNEQNDQAIGFYEHYGFRTFDRSETDSMGDPFPILHMRLT